MSIFSTTANTDFNAFNDPFNAVNMNQGAGQWGMNSAYMTPSYNAPYRPPYSGGGSHIAFQNPGFFRSLYGISPFNTGTPYGIGNQDQDDAYYSSLANRPMDFQAAFHQRITAPLVMFGGAFAMSRAWQVRNQSRGAYDWFRAFGASRQEAMRVSGFTAMGQTFGRGVASGLIAGASRFAPGLASSAFGRIAIGGAAMLGGVAASVALPAALAQGGMEIYNKFISDNYVGIRENQNALRSSFRGITFGGGEGGAFTGQGLSRRAAARMGTELTEMGQRDQIFSPRDVASITSIAAQTGLLDNVSSEQLTSKIGNLMKQMKVVMSVMGSSDYKEVLSSMAKLQAAGVNPSQLGSTMAGIGGLSSIAGISTGRMVNTVGAQGQYLFQSNGVTPIMGQMAGATAMAGMAAAFRSGLVSPELMARMGGVEGAAQLSTTGQLNAAQTTYNIMRNFNRYTTGAGGNGVIGNVSNFGMAMAGNPLGAYGAMIRTRGSNIGQQFRDDGMMGVHNQVMDIANIHPLTAGRGRISADEAMGLMVGTGMMGAQEAQAWLTQYAATQDPRTRSQMYAALRSAQVRLGRDQAEQYGNTRVTAFFSPLVKGYRSAAAGMGRMIGSPVEGVSGIADRFERWWTGATVGSAEEMRSITMRDLQFTGDMRLFDTDKYSGIRGLAANRRDSAFYKQNELNIINRAAMGGNADALGILRGTGKDQANALYRFASSGLLGSDYKDPSTHGQLLDAIAVASRGKRVNLEGDVLGKLQVGLSGQVSGNIEGATPLTRWSALVSAQNLQGLMQGDKDLINSKDPNTQRMIRELAAYNGQQGFGNMSELHKAVNSAIEYAGQNRISTADVFSQYGGGKNIENLVKNPATRGQILKGRFLEDYNRAEAAGDSAGMQRAMLAGFSDTSGATVRAAGISFVNAQFGPDERAEYNRSMNSLDTQQRQFDKLAREGKIDASSYYGASNGIQMSKAVTDFGAYVELFGRKVREISPENSKPNALESLGWFGATKLKKATP